MIKHEQFADIQIDKPDAREDENVKLGWRAEGGFIVIEGNGHDWIHREGSHPENGGIHTVHGSPVIEERINWSIGAMLGFEDPIITTAAYPFMYEDESMYSAQRMAEVVDRQNKDAEVTFVPAGEAAKKLHQGHRQSELGKGARPTPWEFVQMIF